LKWRVKRGGVPDAKLVVNDNSGWNYFIKHFFGFLKFVVVPYSGIFRPTADTNGVEDDGYK